LEELTIIGHPNHPFTINSPLVAHCSFQLDKLFHLGLGNFRWALREGRASEKAPAYGHRTFPSMIPQSVVFQAPQSTVGCASERDKIMLASLGSRLTSISFTGLYPVDFMSAVVQGAAQNLRALEIYISRSKPRDDPEGFQAQATLPIFCLPKLTRLELSGHVTLGVHAFPLASSNLRSLAILSPCGHADLTLLSGFCPKVEHLSMSNPKVEQLGKSIGWNDQMREVRIMADVSSASGRAPAAVVSASARFLRTHNRIAAFELQLLSPESSTRDSSPRVVHPHLSLGWWLDLLRIIRKKRRKDNSDPL